MATLTRYTINHAAGTITFDPNDYVPSPGERFELSAPYTSTPNATGVSGTTITLRIVDLPRNLKILL